MELLILLIVIVQKGLNCPLVDKHRKATGRQAQGGGEALTQTQVELNISISRGALTSELPRAGDHKQQKV